MTASPPEQLRALIAESNGPGLREFLAGFSTEEISHLVSRLDHKEQAAAACLGGVIPLMLKRFGFDPALASAPILTTITDATGFLLTLGLASLWLAARS